MYLIDAGCGAGTGIGDLGRVDLAVILIVLVVYVVIVQVSNFLQQPFEGSGCVSVFMLTGRRGLAKRVDGAELVRYLPVRVINIFIFSEIAILNEPPISAVVLPPVPAAVCSITSFGSWLVPE